MICLTATYLNHKFQTQYFFYSRSFVRSFVCLFVPHINNTLCVCMFACSRITDTSMERIRLKGDGKMSMRGINYVRKYTQTRWDEAEHQDPALFSFVVCNCYCCCCCCPVLLAHFVIILFIVSLSFALLFVFHNNSVYSLIYIHARQQTAHSELECGVGSTATL